MCQTHRYKGFEFSNMFLHVSDLGIISGKVCVVCLDQVASLELFACTPDHTVYLYNECTYTGGCIVDSVDEMLLQIAPVLETFPNMKH